jgi:hypothetical protein
VASSAVNQHTLNSPSPTKWRMTNNGRGRVGGGHDGGAGAAVEALLALVIGA